MDKIRMLMPFEDNKLHPMTCNIDRLGQVFAPNSKTILDKEVAFIAPEEDNGAIVTRALHFGYKRI
jgi:hypothetical protein